MTADQERKIESDWLDRVKNIHKDYERAVKELPYVNLRTESEQEKFIAIRKQYWQNLYSHYKSQPKQPAPAINGKTRRDWSAISYVDGQCLILHDLIMEYYSVTYDWAKSP
jgi:hypothetical protein